MESIAVTNIVSDDMDNIAKLIREVFNKLGDEWKDEIVKERIQKITGGEYTYCYKATDEQGSIVGVLIASPIPEESGYRLHVDMFAVKEDMRGNGIGGRMFEAVCDTARENNIQGLNLLSNHTWDSHIWYHKRGFTSAGWEEHYIEL